MSGLLTTDLLGKARRALRKPPAYVAKRLWAEGVRVTDRWRAPARARAMTEERLLKALGFPDIDTAWDSLTRRPFPFLAEDLDAAALERLAPGETARILADADRALAHQVDLLGSGDVALGPTIDWHTDFKAAHTWPPAYCHSIEYANLGQPSDVKVPWELSRLQWLIPAAQAYRLTGEERYAEGVREVLEQWISANPYAATVNWSCTMEAAIRIFTLTWLAVTLRDSQTFDDTGFRARLLRCIYLHGDFTERYIERSDVNGNHFTADAAGLVVAGLFLGEAATARRWLRLGWAELEAEITCQVHPDGVDFEASAPYHRLVMELFLLPAIYGAAHGLRPTAAWRDRMVAMARFTAAYSQPDGRAPLWGDNDDARALPMSGTSLTDHRYLIGLAALGLGENALLEEASGPRAETAWLFGAHLAGTLPGARRQPRKSVAFPDGGVYVLAGEEDHVFVDCGPLGLAGRGGHGHNDLMSFEAVLAGQRLIVDPGCYVYTASVESRNAFRATAAHNTPQLAGEEINRLFAPDQLWTLRCDAEPEVLALDLDTPMPSIRMTHTGYARLQPPVRPIRSLSLDTARHSLCICDEINAGGHSISIPLHLAPGVSAIREADQVLQLRSACADFKLTWLAEGDWQVAIEAETYAPGYGRLVPIQRVVFRCAGSVTARLAITLTPDTERRRRATACLQDACGSATTSL